MDFDQLLIEHVGEFGKYQKFVYFLVCLAAIPTAFNNMEIVFVAGVPDHHCYVEGMYTYNGTDREQLINASIPWELKDGKMARSQCYIHAHNRSIHSSTSAAQPVKEPCRRWHYDKSVFDATIVSKFNLVCDRQWLIATATSVYMAGLMVGVFISGNLSDRFGRKPILIVSLVIMLVFRIATPFAPNFIVFCLFRFGVGLSSIGWFTTGFVLGIEIVGLSWRTFAGIFVQYWWAIGYLLTGFVAYFVRDWFYLAIILTAPIFLYLSYIWLLPESPRWQYSNKQEEKAEKLMKKICRINGTKLPEKFCIEVDEKVERVTILDILKRPKIRIRSINVFFNWFVNSLVYYGLSISAGSFGSNIYVSFLISGAVEIPAYAMCQVLLNSRLGRRLSLCSTMLVGGVALAVTAPIPAESVAVVVLANIGKFCISASFAIVYVYTSEIFPTVVRNIGVGTSSMFARLGGVIAPFIAQTTSVSRVIPIIVFSVLSITAGLLTLALPETTGHHLPQTLDDGENMENSPICGVLKKPNKSHNKKKSSEKYAYDNPSVAKSVVFESSL